MDMEQANLNHSPNPNPNANSDQFPAGLRVLAVDDDINVLNHLQELCTRCNYNVTPCSEARTALNLLRERKEGPFDLVLSGVRMPDMDCIEFLQHVTNETNLPVLMMWSSDVATTSAMMKSITHGASGFLIKPLREEEIKNIWQHVMRRAFKEENISSLEEYDRKRKGYEISSSVTDVSEGVGRGGGGGADAAAAAANAKENHPAKEAEVDDESEINNGYNNGYALPVPKKRRIVWSKELHHDFMKAVAQLGVHKAVPKRILELMNNPELTRENVASHLQKFRNFLKKAGEGQQQDGMPNRSKLKGFEAMFASGHIPAEMLSNFQSEIFGPPSTSMQLNATQLNANSSNHSNHQNNIASGYGEAWNPTNNNTVDSVRVQSSSERQNNVQQMNHHQNQNSTYSTTLQLQILMQNQIHSNNAGRSNNFVLPQSNNSFSAQFPVENNNTTNNNGTNIFFIGSPLPPPPVPISPAPYAPSVSSAHHDSLHIAPYVPSLPSAHHDSLHQEEAAPVENLRHDSLNLNQDADPNSMCSPKEDLPPSSMAEHL